MAAEAEGADGWEMTERTFLQIFHRVLDRYQIAGPVVGEPHTTWYQETSESSSRNHQTALDLVAVHPAVGSWCISRRELANYCRVFEGLRAHHSKRFRNMTACMGVPLPARCSAACSTSGRPFSISAKSLGTAVAGTVNSCGFIDSMFRCTFIQPLIIWRPADALPN